MKKLVKSRLFAWVAMGLILAIICVTFGMRQVWWSFIDIFFAFMMIFCHLLALYIGKMSMAASRKLDLFALIFGGLTIVAFIGEYVAWHCIQ